MNKIIYNLSLYFFCNIYKCDIFYDNGKSKFAHVCDD